jgi:hypothetical protein
VDKLSIQGGISLKGEITITGAKNAALPILCAALLSAEPITLRNLPDLQDVRTILKILAQMGLKVNFPNPDDPIGDRNFHCHRFQNQLARNRQFSKKRQSLLVTCGHHFHAHCPLFKGLAMEYAHRTRRIPAQQNPRILYRDDWLSGECGYLTRWRICAMRHGSQK